MRHAAALVFWILTIIGIGVSGIQPTLENQMYIGLVLFALGMPIYYWPSKRVKE